MSNLFDALQDAVFNVVAETMGYPAEWLPNYGEFSDELSEEFGPELKTAIVLYKDATASETLSTVDYNIERYMMEYKRGQFPGLKESVSKGNIESVSITISETVLSFNIRMITTKFDGKTYQAILEPK